MKDKHFGVDYGYNNGFGFTLAHPMPSYRQARRKQLIFRLLASLLIVAALLIVAHGDYQHLVAI